MLAAGCFLYRSWEALLIGTVGAIIACISMPLIDKMGIDDPVGASAVHGNKAVFVKTLHSSSFNIYNHPTTFHFMLQNPSKSQNIQETKCTNL
jgi:hypothetical protein